MLVSERTVRHLAVVRSHGPAANLNVDELAAAISSVDGGCAINTCGDAQAAVFMP